MQPTVDRPDRPRPTADTNRWSWPEPMAGADAGTSGPFGTSGPYGTSGPSGAPGDPGPGPRPPSRTGPRRRRGSPTYRWVLVLVGLALGALSLPTTRDALDAVGHRIPGVSWLTRTLGPDRQVPTGWAAVTDAVDPGMVDIETRVADGIGTGAGMVLSPDGRVLTNHHVVDGARRIVVTVVTTGDEYEADVIGADVDEDVAVLQLRDAHGLTPVPLGDPEAVDVGDPIAAIGNAGGAAGLPTVATGTVIGLDQAITATDQDGSDSERLTGMIAVQADVQPGDSGGALATVDGAVVGMTTAASTTGRTSRYQTRAGSGYGFAIPIDRAIAVGEAAVAERAVGGSGAPGGSGSSSGSATTGSRGVLGVQLGAGTTTTGVPVVGVAAGSPAAVLGLVTGDRLLALDGETLGSVDDVVAVLGGHVPGDRVVVTWSDAGGARHRGAATLAAG